MNKLFVFIMLWMMSCLPTLAQAPMVEGQYRQAYQCARWQHLQLQGYLLLVWRKPFAGWQALQLSRRKLLYFEGSQEMDQPWIGAPCI